MLLTRTAIVPPPGFIVRAGDRAFTGSVPAWVRCASSWRLPVLRGWRRAIEMGAVRWHARGDVRVEEVPPPAPPGPGELQLRVRWAVTGGLALLRDEPERHLKILVGEAR